MWNSGQGHANKLMLSIILLQRERRDLRWSRWVLRVKSCTIDVLFSLEWLISPKERMVAFPFIDFISTSEIN